MKIESTNFLEGLNKACGNMDDKAYFQIENTGSDKLIYRERVYCYELYHQLRCILGDTNPYKLQGEMDKFGHPKIPNYKPDFILHVPGDMEQNLVVMEVKTADAVNRDSDDLEKTIKKLKDFITNYFYHQSIILVFGDGKIDLPENILLEIEKLPEEYAKRLLFIWHPGPGKEIEILNENFVLGEE